MTKLPCTCNRKTKETKIDILTMEQKCGGAVRITK